jgi:hypothetical protein
MLLIGWGCDLLLNRADEVIEWLLLAAVHESGNGTNRTNRAGVRMSIGRYISEVPFQGRQDRF